MPWRSRSGSASLHLDRQSLHPFRTRAKTGTMKRREWERCIAIPTVTSLRRGPRTGRLVYFVGENSSMSNRAGWRPPGPPWGAKHTFVTPLASGREKWTKARWPLARGWRKKSSSHRASSTLAPVKCFGNVSNDEHVNPSPTRSKFHRVQIGTAQCFTGPK